MVASESTKSAKHGPALPTPPPPRERLSRPVRRNPVSRAAVPRYAREHARREPFSGSYGLIFVGG